MVIGSTCVHNNEQTEHHRHDVDDEYICVGFSNMKKILKINHDDMDVICQPGSSFVCLFVCSCVCLFVCLCIKK